jgi:asparagine synthase (glutamine-hydrolysing)
MCGIVGVVYHDAERPAPNLDTALACMFHRGPDEQGVFVDGSLVMGMNRLSIIDVAGGHQPMADASERYWIVYNGEIFNFLELRNELSALGYPFRTTCDTEVILAGYHHWGEKILQRLNGMFVFALWDRAERKLWIARDRMGIKPVYYTQLGNAFRFASEIKAILTDQDVPRSISLIGLGNYLTFGHAIAPDTMFDGIYKLLPGHHLTYHDGHISIAKYWDIPATGQPTLTSLQDAIRQSRELVEDAVNSHMVADVPVGAFLSGGIDSATVVALMSRSAGRIKTFSLGFEDDPRSELSSARILAQHFGTEHYEANVTFDELPPLLETLVFHFDEPFGDASSFPTYLVSRLARQHVKVVLTGDGGDELFGGYVRYRAEQLSPWVQATPHAMRQMALWTLNILPTHQHRLKRILRITLQANDALRYAGWSEVFTHVQRESLLTPGYKAVDQNVYAPFEALFAQAEQLDPINRVMYTDLHLRLVNDYLEKVDKATMAASVEARVPLLDYRLVELAQRIPSTFKVSRSETKVLFRRAVADLLPSEVVNLPKHGFSVPIRRWFQGELRDYVHEILTDSQARTRGVFNPEAVEQLWADHKAGRGLYETHLWLLLNFELWARRYLDAPKVQFETPVVPKILSTATVVNER